MDLLAGGGLPDSISVIERAGSVYERPVTDALIEIMQDLYAAQHLGEATVSSRKDLDAIGEILTMADSISDELAERFDLPAVHVTLARERCGRRRRTEKMVPPESGPADRLFTWRTMDRLWTAPLVEPASAWAFWMHKYAHLEWSRQPPVREPRPGFAGRPRLAGGRRRARRPEHFRRGRPPLGGRRSRTNRLLLAVRARSGMQHPAGRAESLRLPLLARHGKLCLAHITCPDSGNRGGRHRKRRPADTRQLVPLRLIRLPRCREMDCFLTASAQTKALSGI